MTPGSSPARAMIAFSPAMTARSGESGVEEILRKCATPPPVSRTRSVKVPPTSTLTRAEPECGLPIADIWAGFADVDAGVNY